MRDFLQTADPVDCVVLDALMPGEASISLVLHLKKVGLPVVVISGSPDAMEHAAENNLQLLRQPFHAQELCDAVNTALSSGEFGPGRTGTLDRYLERRARCPSGQQGGDAANPVATCMLWRSERMRSTDVHRPGGMGVTAPEHEPLWAIGLSVLLIAFVFARRRSGDASSVRGEDRQGETGRGRSADTPSEIPTQGWKDIIFRVYRGISENRILLVAAGVTFYALLAIFPGIAALISIYGL